MELVKISAYAIGYNSGAEFEDSIFVTKETYDLIADGVENCMEIWVGDLDGKHSENECDIEIEHFSGEEDLKNVETDEIGKGVVYNHVDDYCYDVGIDLSAEIDFINTYLKTIDGMESIEVAIPKSQKDNLVQIIEELGGRILAR